MSKVDRPIKSAACGRTTTLLVTDDGMVYSWGSGGALGRYASISFSNFITNENRERRF